VAVTGAAGSAAVLLFVWETQQSAASVVALAVAPLGAVLGAYRPNLIPLWPRIAPIAAVVVALALIGLGVISYSVAPPSVSYGEAVPAQSLEDRTAIVGPTWRSPDEQPLLESSSWSTYEGTISAEWQPRESGLLDAFTDLRLEAWHAQDEAEWLLDPTHREPFAVGSVERSDGGLVGSVVTNRDPDVHAWLVVMTGRAPDGTRYVLDASGGGQSTYTGTAWSWILAVVD
jgi:hypothetical protein